MPTIKDVAKEAGLSIGTVSRALNNRGYLSDEVKHRVAQAMEALDYHPNELARSLQKSKSALIGLIVPSAAHPFFGEIVRYVEGFAYDQGYKLLVCNSLHESEKERDYIKMLKRSQVDGIIMGSHVLDTGDYKNLNLPVVSLDRELSPDIPFVCCDNWQGGEMAARHLIAKGCRDLVHISGSLAVPMLSNKRTEAFTAVCKEAGVSFHSYELSDQALVDFDIEDYLFRILQSHASCDGLFATSDITAAAVMSIAAKIGKRVPDDIKIIGFDGILAGRFLDPPLTTFHQPTAEISRYAVEFLIRMMNGEKVPSKTILPVEFLERGSA
jgi:LacI family sucrose operon transcriptional repressor